LSQRGHTSIRPSHHAERNPAEQQCRRPHCNYRGTADEIRAEPTIGRGRLYLFDCQLRRMCRSSGLSRTVWRCVRRVTKSNRSDCHAENPFASTGCHLRGCNCRVFRDGVDTEAGVRVVVSSRLGVASRMAFWLARLLLGSADRPRCCPACGCRSAAGRLWAAAGLCPSCLDPTTLEWPLLGPRTLGMKHQG
jgi:hypothetical protein